MTPRAVEVLKSVDTVLAEDTRTSSVLLRHFDIPTPMRSHHKFNEHEAVAAVVEQLKGGAVMALISDAGTPGISDPGFLLSRECRRQGIEVETCRGLLLLSLHWSTRVCRVTGLSLRASCRRRKAVPLASRS